MSLDLTGIDNINEFYSHHYLVELLEGDLKGLWDKWKAAEEQGVTVFPPKALRGLKKRHSDVVRQIVSNGRQTNVKWRTELAENFHTELLKALGYPEISTWPGCEIVPTDEPGEVVPVRLALVRDGEPHLLVIEAPWPEQEGMSILESPIAAPENLVLDENERVTRGDVEDAVTALFSSQKPPKWILALGGTQILLAERGRWGQGRYLRFDLNALFDLPEAAAMRAAAALLAADALWRRPSRDPLRGGQEIHLWGTPSVELGKKNNTSSECHLCLARGRANLQHCVET